MRPSKFLFLCIYGIVMSGLCSPAFSQFNTAIGKVTISSPTAASLGKYGDIPVSLHTGIPDIQIPIYTIKSGSLELPISLSYHAGGLQVQEQASWIGAGWALNAGGVITRTVVGAPDDKGLFAAFTQKGHYSDYGYNSYLFSPGPATCFAPPYVCPQGRPGMPSNNNAPQDAYIQTGIFDGEPDLFFFNFNGYVGKFYFNDDRTPMIIPEQDLKIVPIYTGSDWRGFSGFIITTPDGVQYYFGQNPLTDGNTDAVDITYNVTTQTSYDGQGASSAWYLNRIVSADGQFSISLIYQPENYSYYTYSMFPIPAVRNPNIFAYNFEYDLDKNFINGVRLSKIVFSTGEVDFNAGALRQDLAAGTQGGTSIAESPNNDGNAGGRALGSIAIKSNDVCKQFNFSTSYWFDSNPLSCPLLTVSFPAFNITSDQYRLRLDSVNETSCDNSIRIPAYKFAYYDGTVPRKLSFGIDHWGFYNGVTNNTGLIPTYQILPAAGQTAEITTVAGADRDTHWPNSLNGALQKITYPTNGSSAFEFESNDVYSSSTSTTTAGLTNLVVQMFGQSALSNSGNFVTDGDAIDISWTNNSSVGGSLNITNTSGTLVYTTGIGSNSINSVVVSIPAGLYTATLTTSSATSPNGIQASITQIQTTTTAGRQPVGGLRIRTITNKDDLTANDVVKTYRYTWNNTDNGQSTGILFSRPIYVLGIRNDPWGAVSGANCSIAGCMTCFNSNVSYDQSPSSIRPMATSQGNHIGYGEVYVSQTGNGYTENRFYSSNGAIPHVFDPPIPDVCVRSLSTFCDPNLPNSPAPPDPFDPMRGEQAFIGVYDQNGHLLQSKSYLPVFQFNPITTPGIISTFFVTGYMSGTSSPATYPLSGDPTMVDPSITEVPVGINTFTEYTLQTAHKISDQVTTNTFDPANGGLITEVSTTIYGSSYHHQPTQTVYTSSKGETIQSNYKNAFDFRISNFNVPDQLGTYTSNIASDNSYVSNALAAVPTSDNTYYTDRLNIYTNYRYMKAIDRQNYIAYRRQNFTNPVNDYQSAHDVAKAGADAELKPILQLQDEYFNPVIEETNRKNGNLLHAGFVHYDFPAGLSNIVYPGKAQMVNLQLPSSSFTDAAVNGFGLTKDSRYADETSVTYNAGNPQQVISHNGIANSYIWDYANTEPVARTINATADQVAYTSFEAEGSGGFSISNTAGISNTNSITGSKCYQLSLGGISRGGLNPSTVYTFSYWTTNGSPITLTGNTAQPLQGKTINGWTYFEHNITGVSQVVVPQSSGLIDELRLYPAAAHMTTYTYRPLLGISSECDVNNRVTYYNYDALGRLQSAKDQDGNIIKTIEYHYKGQ